MGDGSAGGRIARGRLEVALATAVLAAALAVLSTLHPLEVLSGERLFGAGTADIWGHAWSYQRVADGLQLWRPQTAWPDGQAWWVIDMPIALLLVPVTRLFSAAQAYNAAFLLHIAVGAGTVTAWLHGRTKTHHAVIAGLLVSASPFVHGALTSGVPEALSVLFVPAFAWALHLGLRGSNRALLGAGLLGALVVLDGAYGALQIAIVGPVLVVVSGPRVAPRGLLAAVPAVIAALGVRAALVVTNHPAYGKEAETEGAAAIQTTDLLDWVLGSEVGGETLHAHVVLVGFVLLVAALSQVRERRAWAFLSVAAAAVVVSLGPELQVGGHGLFPLPGALLGDTGANNLYRVGGIVPLVLVVVVALAADGRARWLLVWALVAIEWTWSPGQTASVPTTENPIGAVERWLGDQPEPGAVLDLPLDLEGTEARGSRPQRTFFLSTEHGRGVASGLYVESPVLRVAGPVRVLRRFVMGGWAAGRPAEFRPADHGPPPQLPPDLRDEEIEHLDRALAELGFQFVSLDLELIEPSQREETDAWVSAWLGPPQVEEGLRRAWRLRLTTTNTDPAMPVGPRSPSPESSPSHRRR